MLNGLNWLSGYVPKTDFVNPIMNSDISDLHGGEYKDRPDDEGSKLLRNVGKLLQYYTAQHPRRQ
jgi:nitrogen fixation protein